MFRQHFILDFSKFYQCCQLTPIISFSSALHTRYVRTSIILEMFGIVYVLKLGREAIVYNINLNS